MPRAFPTPEGNRFECMYGGLSTLNGAKVVWKCRFRYTAQDYPYEAPGKRMRKHLSEAHAVQDVNWTQEPGACDWAPCSKFLTGETLKAHGTHMTKHAYKFICPYYLGTLVQGVSCDRSCRKPFGTKHKLRTHLSGYHRVVVDSLSQRMHSEWDQLAFGVLVK